MSCICVDPNYSGRTLLLENYLIIFDPRNPHFECVKCHRSFAIELYQCYKINYCQRHTIGWEGSPTSDSGTETANYTLSMIEAALPANAIYNLIIEYSYYISTDWPEQQDPDDQVKIHGEHNLDISCSAAGTINYKWDATPSPVNWRTVCSDGATDTSAVNSGHNRPRAGKHMGGLHPHFRFS